MKKALALFMMGTVMLGMGSVVSAKEMKVHVTYMDIDLWDELKQLDVEVDEKVFEQICDYTVDFDPVLFKADEVKGYYYDPEESYYYTDIDESSLEVYLAAGEGDTSAKSDDAEVEDETEGEELVLEGDIPKYISEVVDARKSMEYTLLDDEDGISLSIPEDIKYHDTSECWILPFAAENNTEKTIVVHIDDVCVNGMNMETGQYLYVEPGDSMEDEMLITKYDLDCLGIEDIRYLYFSYAVENDEDMSEIREQEWSPMFVRGDDIVKDTLPYGDVIYEDEQIGFYIMPTAFSTNNGEMLYIQYLAENRTDDYICFYGKDPVLINGKEVVNTDGEPFQNYMSYVCAPQMGGYHTFQIDLTTLGFKNADEVEEIEFPICITTRDSDKINIQTEAYSFAPIIENR